MKRMLKLFTLSTVLLLAGCATAAGAAIGGGIGSIPAIPVPAWRSGPAWA